MERSLPALVLGAMLLIATPSPVSAQITSTTTGGDWWESSTWIAGIVPTEADDVLIQGPVVIRSGDACRNLTVAASGSIGDLQGGSFQDQLLVAGNADNAGVIQDVNPPNARLSIRVLGNVVNRGVWKPANTVLDGSSTQSISTVGSGLIESQWLNNVIEADIELASDILVGATDFRLRGGRLKGNGFTITADSLSQITGGTVVGPVVLDGRHSLQDLVFDGMVTNMGILEAFNGGSFVDNMSLINESTLINRGVIRNSPAQFTITIDGTVINEGVWVTRSTKFVGIEDHVRHAPDAPLSGTWYASDSTTVVADTALTFSAARVQLRPGLLDMAGHALTLSNLTTVDYTDVRVDSISFLDESRIWQSTIISDVIFTGTARIGGPVVVEGDFIAADTLIDSPGNSYIENIQVLKSFTNTGVVQGLLDVSVGGDVWINGPFAARRLILTGNGLRTVTGADSIQSAVYTDGTDVALSGMNVLPGIVIDYDGFVRTTQGTLVVPEDGIYGGVSNFKNFGSVTMHAPARTNDYVDFYDAMARTSQVDDYDTLFVETWGNQTPRTYGSAVRNWWRVYTDTGSGDDLQLLELRYTDQQLADNVEDSLQVYQSTDDGQTWVRVSIEANLTRDPDNNNVTITQVPPNGDYLLSSTPDPISVAPNIVVTFTGRDVIRIGAPLRYTYSYANTSTTATGDIAALLSFGGIGHISKIVTDYDNAEDEIELLPEDFLGEDLPADSVAVLWISSMDPGEVRTFSVEAWSDLPSSSASGKTVDAQFDLVTVSLTIVVVVAAEALARELDFKSSQMYQMCKIVREDYEFYSSTDIEDAWRRARREALRVRAKETKLTSASRIYGVFAAVLKDKLGSFAAKRVATNVLKCLGEVLGGARDFAERNNPLANVCPLNNSTSAKGLDDSGLDGVRCPANGVFGVTRKLEPVTSIDPNEKKGPAGIGLNGFLSASGRMDYTIFFENLETASAAAYRITIDDTLDVDFDAATVEVGVSSHPGFTFSQDGAVLHWEIEGIELPPNVNPPEGEGFVSFSVYPHGALPSGTILSNRASIVFDLNEAIITNTHENTLDFDPPVTTMTAFSGPQHSDSTKIRWASDDGFGSGVGQSAVFASANDGPFEWIGNALGSEFNVATPESGTYRFYALAIDKVGNAESVRPQPSTVEVTHVGVDEIEAFAFELRPSYPNPFSESTTITYSFQESGEATVSVYDVLGRRVKVLDNRIHEPGQHRVVLNADGLASGLYFVRLSQGKKRAIISVVLLE